MKQILYKLFEHQYLGRDEARTILQNIAQGKYNDVQVASLITVFLMRIFSISSRTDNIDRSKLAQINRNPHFQ